MSTSFAAQGLRAAGDRAIDESSSRRLLNTDSKYIAPPMRETLRVFKRTQLLGRMHQHIGVGSDCEGPTRIEVFLRRENPVA